MEIEFYRAIERLLVVAFAGTSIILGWHLFKIGVVSPQSGELKGKGLSITLQKVGPGIFFSLFGTIVLSISLINGIKIEPNPQDGSSTSRSFQYLNSNQVSFDVKITRSINTLQMITVENLGAAPVQKQAIESAIENLKTYRDLLAVKKFGKDKIKFYNQCSTTVEQSCRQTRNFKEIEKWLTDTLLGQS